MPIRRPVSGHSLRARPPLAVPGLRIGLLGGSFNPAHEGHRLVSVIARQRLGLDRVWWLVSPGNPLKDHSVLAPLSQRLHEAHDVAAAPWIEITDFEGALGSAFTVDTLTYLKRRCPGVHFVWLMGADNLASVHRWRHWQQIFRMLPVAVVDRPGWHLAASASRAARTFSSARVPEHHARRILQLQPPAWTLLTGPLSQASSTQLRAQQKL